jgi:hypothetical protein
MAMTILVVGLTSVWTAVMEEMTMILVTIVNMMIIMIEVVGIMQVAGDVVHMAAGVAHVDLVGEMP